MGVKLLYVSKRIIQILAFQEQSCDEDIAPNREEVTARKKSCDEEFHRLIGSRHRTIITESISTSSNI
jgi:hypothetical protein